jgi:hypothetical protein
MMNSKIRNGIALKFPLLISLFVSMLLCGNAAYAGSVSRSDAPAWDTNEGHPPVSGFPFDWSYLHVSVAGDKLSGSVAQREHRLLYSFLRRNQLNRVVVSAPDLMQATKHIDWDVPLGAPMADGAYPAKFNFNLPGETPTCQDFVVYGLNTPGTTGGQPNLVGLTNLYSGTVGGTGLCKTDSGVYQDIFWTWVYAATVKFAYNGSTIGGSITNSVVMSENGLKVAYVESTGTASAFHVVTLPVGNGTGTLASAVTTAAASATLPPAIATVPSAGSWAADSYSSVWVDYTNDLAYVGTNDGSLHKIQNVFCTTPACVAVPVAPSEVTAPGIWPVTLAGAGALTSPVQDANGVIYVDGAATGKLYAVTPAASVTTSTQSFMPNSVVDGPMLDVDGNGTTQALYWFSNSQSAVSSPSVQQPQMVQTNRALTTFNNYPLLLNGTATWGSNGATTAVPVHAGTFDNAFYNNRNGNMWACGWWQNSQYGGNHLGVVRFGINGTTVTPDTSKVYSQLSPDWISAINTCSPVTEVLDSSGNDHIFVSSRFGYPLSAGTCISQASCVSGYTIGLSGTGSYGLNTVGNSALYSGYTSGIIVDNDVNPASSTCGPGGNQSCAQASSIYFTFGNEAIKLTQAQLQ